MVLFTGGDELRDHSIEQMIQDNKSVSKLVSMCGGRYSVFDNTQRGNRQQVRDFLNTIDDMVAARSRGGEHCTCKMFRVPETLKPKWKILEFLLAVLLGVLVGGVIGEVARVMTGGVGGAVSGVLFGAW